MKTSTAKFIAALAATLGLSFAAVAQSSEPKVLNIYNWSDYIAEDTIKNFEKETGIKVRYDNLTTGSTALSTCWADTRSSFAPTSLSVTGTGSGCAWSFCSTT